MLLPAVQKQACRDAHCQVPQLEATQKATYHLPGQVSIQPVCDGCYNEQCSDSSTACRILPEPGCTCQHTRRGIMSAMAYKGLLHEHVQQVRCYAAKAMCIGTCTRLSDMQLQSRARVSASLHCSSLERGVAVLHGPCVMQHLNTAWQPFSSTSLCVCPSASLLLSQRSGGIYPERCLPYLL